MMSAPLPKNEAQRLESIERPSVIDAPADQRFDWRTRVACRMFDAPTGARSDSQCAPQFGARSSAARSVAAGL